MPKNTSKPKAIKFKLPEEETPKGKVILPFNGKIVESLEITFSFSSFDRTHELFNLGGKEKDGTVGGQWFLRLLDCLKSVGGKKLEELKKKPYCLHPVKWETANTKCPTNSKQAEYWQFRLDKSHGRIIGILVDAVFYVVWLDPYHNLTDSEGYGGIQKFPAPKVK